MMELFKTRHLSTPSTLQRSVASQHSVTLTTLSRRQRRALRLSRAGQARRGQSRRSGIAMLYFTLGLSTFMGVTALVVDMGSLYTRRAQAQRAADAGALAGALELRVSRQGAIDKAREYARDNGYKDSEITGVVVSTSTGSAVPNRVSVHVERAEPLYFLPAMAALFEGGKNTRVVGATGVAQVGFPIQPVDLSIEGGGDYGTSKGFANPSIFGPDAYRYNGDPYSPVKLSGGAPNATTIPGNPTGADFPGYDYKLAIAPNYIADNGGSPEVQLSIFDPDCYTANGLEGWDEIRPPNGGTSTKPETTTRYTIFAPNGEKVGEVDYSNDPATNLKWAAPPELKFDITDPRWGYNSNDAAARDFKIRVKAIDGSSENGFQFRASRPYEGLDTVDDEPAWTQQYNNNGSGNGTQISATGKVPLNFTTTGQVTITLGRVPGEAKGGLININKFDTDIEAKSIVYTCDELPGFQQAGTLASDDTWAADQIVVPENYPATGGTWKATYQAGANDTSCWTMNWSKQGSTPGGAPGPVKLIQ